MVLSVPVLAGATALTLAVAGALTLSASRAETPREGHLAQVAGPTAGSTPAPTAGRAGSITRAGVLAGRERVVSRDSRRAARENDVAQDLQAVAERRAKVRDTALAKLAVRAEKRADQMAENAWQLPVTPGAYHLTSRFGDCSGLWSRCHTGLDFAAPSGTPIHAIANGTITEMESAGAYGNRTIETLKDGTELWYCHQTAFVAATGDRVTAGEVIGLVGSTGNTTGPHVHVEVRPRPDEPIDPYAQLVAHGLQP